MSYLSKTTKGICLKIKVLPRASKTEFCGIAGDEIKIKLQSPPVDGKANKALIEFLSEFFGISKSCVELLSGETSRKKRVFLHGVSEESVLDKCK